MKGESFPIQRGDENKTGADLRRLPAVYRLLDYPPIRRWMEEGICSREYLAQEVTGLLQTIREEILAGRRRVVDEEEVMGEISSSIQARFQPQLKRVINGTGILLHTNLGRAPLSDEAVNAMVEIARSYSNLEYNLEKGERGSRHDHVEELICRLTGAEASMVVNNNAAAVFLVLRELAAGREVIVSRGELVEIGGSFRVSEIMRESGAILVEVGTTNKTNRGDYEKAITERTALLLKVHPSNFRMVGFTQEVEISALAEIGKKYGLPVYQDLGSGILDEFPGHSFGNEPTARKTLSSGADLISFSGDKLLGGPQAGIIAGKRKWIERLKKNQLARVLRVDKLTLAALEATLRLYLNPKRAMEKIPIVRDLFLPADQVKKKAERFLESILNEMEERKWRVELGEVSSEVGGGTLPTHVIPSWALLLSHDQVRPVQLERALRQANPPVIGRIVQDRFCLDFRTIREEEYPALFRSLMDGLANVQREEYGEME
ncbi:L-seryl-tRNA(Sec) selenium transferase [[Clostridium] ultunense Esp]|nr:L-seryl-tRNA(Sec) selenium transferase [[Clostridium] ultunense Esp]